MFREEREHAAGIAAEPTLAIAESELAVNAKAACEINLPARSGSTQQYSQPPQRDQIMVCQLDPLVDARWSELVENHSRASLFHSPAWLEALLRTYGYKHIAYATLTADNKLDSGLVFSRVESWLTGRRLVSLPFSDHCEPLVGSDSDFRVLSAAVEKDVREGAWRYAEMRRFGAAGPENPAWRPVTTYAFHELDLSSAPSEIFQNFHKQSTQRKIRRAEREGLGYEEGSSEFLLNQFYNLLVLTRRRHRVPPQPKAWFQNLRTCCGDALKFRLALHGIRPVAAMITIHHKDTLVYKYGASDSRYNNLGGMHLLHWRAIQDAQNMGLKRFDLGRSDAHQTGLITFKNRWGASQTTLVYARCGNGKSSFLSGDPSHNGWTKRAANILFAHAPTRSLTALSKLLYKHMG